MRRPVGPVPGPDGEGASVSASMAAVGLSAADAPPGNRDNRIEHDATRARPPSWRFHAVVVFFALVLLAARSDPNRDSVATLVAMVVLVVAAITWLVRLAVFLVRTRRGTLSEGRIWFAFAPVVGVVMASLLLPDAPLRTRWALSKDAFDAELERVRSGDEESHPGGRLGWYDVLFSSKEGNGVIFYTEFHDDEEGAGFVYLPTGLGLHNQNQAFWGPQLMHLGGHWYAFEMGGFSS
jgi:heme/copper-type cytochrome/quinol oxidase subunit 4